MNFRLSPADRTRRLDRGRGRHIGWSEWGAENGRPILYCTGAGMSGAIGFGFETLRELDLRLICIDRPGLGLSDPDPEKSFESYAEDVAFVLRKLGTASAPAVGFSQGAPFAVALAAANLAPSLALVAGQDELAHPLIRSKLHPEVARMVEAIEADRDAFEADFAPRVDAEGLWSLVLGMSAPSDRANYESPAFAPLYRRSLEEGFAQGPAGYVRDLTLAMGRWPTPPEKLEATVALWYGTLDTSPVHSPDFGETLAGRFPNAELHQQRDQGGSILWTSADAILRELVATPE